MSSRRWGRKIVLCIGSSFIRLMFSCFSIFPIDVLKVSIDVGPRQFEVGLEVKGCHGRFL